eukprot:366456-Chlamydomonas_euryale.AAC.12
MSRSARSQARRDAATVVIVVRPPTLCGPMASGCKAAGGALSARTGRPPGKGLAQVHAMAHGGASAAGQSRMG